MIINPGLLKHKVIFYRYIQVVDSEGFKKREYSKILECKAHLEKCKSVDTENKGMAANINSVKDTINCVIRYFDINNNDKVELNGKMYKIIKIEDIDFQKRFLRITLNNE